MSSFVTRRTRRSRFRFFAVPLTFVVALVLMAVPLPDWALHWRPDFVSMVLIYWCLALPHRVGLVSAFALGLVVDVMHGGLLGQNALAKVLIAAVVIWIHLRMRMFPLWQQALVVLGLICLHQAVMLLTYNFTGGIQVNWRYLLPAVSSMVLWPWLFILLRDLRRASGTR
ncbi:MAG: rod shape-determining protein MreD [Gammaproteobacteria bacterium]|jgi:rod shape-determining protein MreD|nr:rod shape-determining protein MreD [Gammaproteobacteria bacterium]